MALNEFGAAALRFFRKIMTGQGRSPRQIVIEKLAIYSAAKAVINNHFRPGHHLLKAVHYREIMGRRFAECPNNS